MMHIFHKWSNWYESSVTKDNERPYQFRKCIICNKHELRIIKFK